MILRVNFIGKIKCYKHVVVAKASFKKHLVNGIRRETVWSNHEQDEVLWE